MKHVVDPHYIVSLKHTAGSTLRLWAPQAMGYVDTLERAGRFAGDEVREDARRYNNGLDALAVPCALVEAVAAPVGKGHVVRRSRLAALTNAAARVARFHVRAGKPAGGST